MLLVKHSTTNAFIHTLNCTQVCKWHEILIRIYIYVYIYITYVIEIFFCLQVKHAQCFDVALMDDGSIVLASKDYRLYVYRYLQLPAMLP